MRPFRMLKKTLSLMLTGTLLAGAIAGSGINSVAAAGPADAFSEWELSGFTPKTIGGEAVLVGGGVLIEST